MPRRGLASLGPPEFLVDPGHVQTPSWACAALWPRERDAVPTSTRGKEAERGQAPCARPRAGGGRMSRNQVRGKTPPEPGDKGRRCRSPEGCSPRAPGRGSVSPAPSGFLGSRARHPSLCQVASGLRCPAGEEAIISTPRTRGGPPCSRPQTDERAASSKPGECVITLLAKHLGGPELAFSPRCVFLLRRVLAA